LYGLRCKAGAEINISSLNFLQHKLENFDVKIWNVRRPQHNIGTKIVGQINFHFDTKELLEELLGNSS